MSERPHLALALEAPLAYGGGVSVIVRTLLGACREDYRVSLVSPDTTAEVQAAGFGWLAHHLSWPRQRASRARAVELAGHLRGWKVGLAHFHCGGNYGFGNRRPGTSPLPLLRRAGTRCVTTVHSIVSPLADAIAPDSPWWKQAAAWPISWLGKMSALRGTDAEIAVSRHDAALLQKWYRPARRRFRQIYHSRLPEAPSVSLLGREKVILHVGHRAPRKGQDLLVRAFGALASQFPEWRLHFIGAPGELDFERALAGPNITLDGPREGLAPVMASAAIYVQPSRQEALGLALQEALYHGCAAIGTEVGGIPELIEAEHTGLLIPPAVEPMTAALARLMEDAALRNRLGAAAGPSILAKGMTAPAMLRAHFALYQELLDGH